MTLKDDLVLALSSRQPSKAELPMTPATLHPGDVIEWSPSFLPVAYFLQVRGERCVAWSVRNNSVHPTRVASFLAATPDEDLDRLSPDRAVERVDVTRWEGFSSWAATHPSAHSWNPSANPRVKELLSNRVFLVFPCHRCEVAREMDGAWFKQHAIPYTDTTRPPHAASKVARFTNPAAPKPRLVGRAPRGEEMARQVTTRDVLEFENSERHVLRLHNGMAFFGGESRSVSGVADAVGLLKRFLEDDTWLATPLPPDQLQAGRLYEQLEAMSGDVVDGIEPVTFQERSTKQTVARAWVWIERDVLRVEYQLLDARLGDGLAAELINEPYLRVLTRHSWNKRASCVELRSRVEPSKRLEYAYPSK